MSKITFDLAQCNFLVGDVIGNTDSIIRTVQQSQADIVVFPELCLVGYPPEDLLFRPYLYVLVQQAITRLCEISRHSAAMIIGYPAQQGGHCFNQAALIANGAVQAIATKQALPNYTVFDEKRYFTEGHSSTVVEFKGVKLGLLICEDLWVPAPIAAAKQAGAELVLVINASPYHVKKLAMRSEILQQRIREVGLPIGYVNSLGGQDELVFDGASVVLNAQGDVVAQAACFQEQILSFQYDTCSSILSSQNSISPIPEPIAMIYQALVLGLRDYVEKNKFPSVLLGLSGGIDSALTLAIAVDAIGAKRVEAILMPSRYTASMSIEDAISEANALGANYHLISIEPIFQAYLQELQAEFGDMQDLTQQNLQARCRGMILMALSNNKNALVLTTGNKSELAVGYATLYGDMAGGFSVLKDVLKTTVYELAHWRNRQGGIVIPERVLTRAPSAELKPSQVDQDTLPPYAVLDDIIVRYIECDQSIEEIVTQTSYATEVVQNVVKMINRNEYKRRQAAVGVCISRRAFGKDRRYPITSGYQF